MVSRSKTSARTVPQGVDGISARVEGENAADGRLGGKESESLESSGDCGESGDTRGNRAVLLAEHAGASVFHADWRALLGVVPECDAVIVDAPYSERTHAGHNGGAADAGGDIERPDITVPGKRLAMGLGPIRHHIRYGSWTGDDVREFVGAWAPRCSGWFASITDHNLVGEWTGALGSAGRYVFSPLAFVAVGSRIRFVGDGPSQWATWIVVARPRSREFASWGTLPGAYVLPHGVNDMRGGAAHGMKEHVTGGKPLWLMERPVEDYTRPGALVVDPCCGAGTTLVAAQRTGRRAIGGDAMREHAEIAAKRISKPAQAPLWVPGSNTVSHATQSQLFDEEEGDNGNI